MSNWQTFDPTRFVGRQQERQQCLDWLRQDQPGRLYSFVGAAGTGKTWLLHALMHDLAEADLRADRYVPVFISFPQIAADMASTSVRYSIAVHRSLDRIMQAMSPQCGTFPEIADDIMAKQMVTIFAKTLCEDRNLRPVIIVEGYDEIDHNLAIRLAQDLLYVFLGYSQARIVMGRRDITLRDVDLLRMADYPVLLHADASGLDQFQSILRCFPEATHLSDVELPRLQLLVPDYQWNHYFVNGYLYATALERQGAPFQSLITTDDCERCCRDLVFRSGRHAPPAGDPDPIALLKRIAKELARNWTEPDLQRVIGRRLIDVEHLFLLGAIARHPVSIQRFCIADGLYEILRTLP